MATTGNLVNIGHGVFVSEASLARMERSALQDVIKQIVADSLEEFGMKYSVESMVRASIKDIAAKSKQEVQDKTRRHIEHITVLQIKALVDQAVKDAVLSELSKAGLDRQANVLVWSAINNMRKAAMQS